MKKKIFFLINNLGGGGAEKVLIHLINFMPRDKYEPILVLIDEEEEYLEAVNSNIKIIYLHKKRWIDIFKVLLNLIIALYREKPEISISFLAYSNILMMISRLFCFFKIKIILTEHTLLKEHLLAEQRFSLLKILLSKILFPFSDCILTVSKSAKNNLIKNFHIKDERIKLIYNPCDLNEIDLLKCKKEDLILPFKDKPYLISVGRFIERKKFDNIIKAFNLIKDEINENLILLGQGHQYDNLKKLCVDLKLEERVFFLGFKKNPFIYMKNASAFVFVPEHESFGMVIVEAMAAGTPVITSKGDAGPGEIVNEGENGLLVDCNNLNEIGSAIKKVVSSNLLRDKLIKGGYERSKDFSVEKIFNEYDELLETF